MCVEISKYNLFIFLQAVVTKVSSLLLRGAMEFQTTRVHFVKTCL